MRANALEDNVVLYKVEGGKRISLEPKGTPSKTYGVKHKVPKQTWSTLKVSFDGPHFEVFFDGSKIMEVEDTTFTAAGKAGFWTKADSVTLLRRFPDREEELSHALGHAGESESRPGRLPMADPALHRS